MTALHKHVVVTGGTGALGTIVVKALVEAGAHCHVPAIETAVPADRFPRERVSVVTSVDLAGETAVLGYYGKLPPLAGVINIAGGFAWAPIADSSVAVLQQQLSMNLISCALCCRAAVANFRKAGQGGLIVNVSARPCALPAPGRQHDRLHRVEGGGRRLHRGAGGGAQGREHRGDRALSLDHRHADQPRRHAQGRPRRWVKPSAIADLIVAQLGLRDPINSGALIPVYGRA